VEIKVSAGKAASFILFVTGIYLDDCANTIVAEAHLFDMPLADKSSEAELKALCESSIKVVVGNKGVKFWKSALAAMAERCRNWEQNSRCRFENVKPGMGVDLGILGGCECRPKDPSFLRHKVWGKIASNNILTRVAISPIFTAPFFEATRGHVQQILSKKIDGDSDDGNLSCDREGCSEAPTIQCDKCGKRNYCSKTCQRSHWKKAHKLDCEGVKTINGTPTSENGEKTLTTKT